ncbi:hypothetical protein NHJ13734_009715 [Beauveria thailandica]
MTSTYTVNVNQTSKDRRILNANKYNLQIAKSASHPGGSPKFNIVYKSTHLAPEMDVSWTETYGLNWTQKLGDSYDLNSNGDWQSNSNNPNAHQNALNVGSNGYGSPINILVGIQDPNSRQWTAIYIEESQLLPKGHGEFQPRESVELWYQERELTETMISGQSTEVKKYDMAPTPTRWFWYNTGNGKWYDQDHPFPHD